MTRRTDSDDGSEGTDPLQDVIRYAPGLIAFVLTVGVSVIEHLPVSRPGLQTTVVATAVPAALVALAISRSDWNPSGSRFALLTLLSWGVFSLVRLPLLNPSSARIDGSVYVLVDLGLVWLGSYALTAAVVYGVDWPTPHVASEPDPEPADPDPADD